MSADVMNISNDGRGWIMTAMSGVACVVGAAFICIDILIRQFPGKRNFHIRDSDTFLSLSLSLSFGVMIFSALYNMLPSAKSSLIEGGHSSRTAAWILIGCFIGGIAGIQILSRVMHHFLPHDVVPCEHTHEDDESHKEDSGSHQHQLTHRNHHANAADNHAAVKTQRATRRGTGIASWGRASQPPVQQMNSVQPSQIGDLHASAAPQRAKSQGEREAQHLLGKRPTLRAKISSTFAKLASGQDAACGCEGPCHGYNDLCRSDCFKTIGARAEVRVPKPSMGVNRPSAIKSVTATETTPLLHDVSEEPLTRPRTRAVIENVDAHPSDSEHGHQPSGHSSNTFVDETDGQANLQRTHSHSTEHSSLSTAHEDSSDPRHHHHIPTNAFASIGLQTCIAIALHKLPEGFITYATNHANPKLGVSVFVALFIHNITEGFVMALPLYLAINNRLKAMIITLVLGGLSQPVGAGVAALWFKLAGKSGWTPSVAGYGGMFAVTAGIMASVALQLYAEAVDKAHSKDLCLVGAFTGMLVMGCSAALTA